MGGKFIRYSAYRIHFDDLSESSKFYIQLKRIYGGTLYINMGSCKNSKDFIQKINNAFMNPENKNVNSIIMDEVNYPKFTNFLKIDENYNIFCKILEKIYLKMQNTNRNMTFADIGKKVEKLYEEYTKPESLCEIKSELGIVPSPYFSLQNIATYKVIANCKTPASINELTIPTSLKDYCINAMEHSKRTELIYDDLRLAQKDDFALCWRK